MLWSLMAFSPALLFGLLTTGRVAAGFGAQRSGYGLRRAREVNPSLFMLALATAIVCAILIRGAIGLVELDSTGLAS